MADRVDQQTYEFFRALHAEAEKQEANLHQGGPPRSFPHWTAQVQQHFIYGYVANMHAARVELVVDRSGDKDWNKKTFDALHAQKDAIEGIFGGSLNWLRLDQHNVSRITLEFDGTGLLDQNAWPELHAKMVSAMIRLERATRPYVERYAGADSNPNDPPAPPPLPEEVTEPQLYPEGAVHPITINAYERNPKARADCLMYHGVDCAVCGFNFARFYGEIGEDFIHVHHLCPLSEIAVSYHVDPIRDLRPVCPNCHAMLHRRSPPLSIEELRERIGRYQ